MLWVCTSVFSLVLAARIFLSIFQRKLTAGGEPGISFCSKIILTTELQSALPTLQWSTLSSNSSEISKSASLIDVVLVDDPAHPA